MKKLTLLLTFLFILPTALAIIEGNEQELIRLVPEGIDDDNDTITYTYSEPFNESGEWLPSYDDAGTYNVVVTATDGISVSKANVTVKVKNVNRKPTIKNEDIKIQEGEKVRIIPNVEDPDGDKVDVEIKSPFDEKEGETDYEDAGEYDITIIASDGKLETIKTIKLEIENVNRKPKITSQKPKEKKIEIKEGESIHFRIKAKDSDDDKITFEWKLNGKKVSKENEFDLNTSYQDSGEYTLEAAANDGELTDKVVWEINVENVNRKPEIKAEDITGKEGESIRLDLPRFDSDREEIEYEISWPFNNQRTWEPSYDDAGTYNTTIKATDGIAEVNKTIQITIEDVDRAPKFPIDNQIEIKESDSLQIPLKATDPDGDKITYKTDTGKINKKGLVWKPGYDYVPRNQDFTRKILQSLNLEKLLKPNKKTKIIGITACGKNLCTTQNITVTVIDDNRAPIIEDIAPIEINETDILKIPVNATDPDGDKIAVSFPPPMKKGRWKTTYEDGGNHLIVVRATDGNLYSEKTVKVTVNEKNRPPKFKRISNRDVNENETLWIRVEAKDPDGDKLQVRVENFNHSYRLNNNSFSWTPSYDLVEGKPGFFAKIGAMNGWLNRKLNQNKINVAPEFIASDGKEETNYPVTITVRDRNRKPTINTVLPATKTAATIGYPTLFTVNATDLDGDKLFYTWKLGRQTYKGGNSIKRTFTQTGNKKIKVIVSDGKNKVQHTWKVQVGAQAQTTRYLSTTI